MEDEKQIFEENPCQTQLELASELGVTQQVPSPTKTRNSEGILGPS